MALVKSIFVFLVCVTAAPRTLGQAPLNFTSNMVYNVVGNSTHSVDFFQYRRANSTKDTFVNRTLSQIPSGVCIKEVPTASLIADPRNGIPIGNGSTPEMSRIHVCCEGYQRDPHIFRKCSPICSQECVNGICVAPNRCQCYPDHVHNLAGYCVATCPIGCYNGECDSNVCRCKPGYQLEPNRRFCIPKCSQGCLHGNCTEPEVCTCNAGFELIQGKCTPICEGGCDFGECVAPGQCSCIAGYQKSNGRCEPICTRGCNNGHCVRPNVCECGAGWSLDATGINCVPGCSRPCLNGVCSAADTCACHKGYVLDPVDPFKCIAFCANGCPNGVCSAPNLCLCNVGFVKDRSVKGSQNCIPRQ
ncbi:von Willebrand factor D and EGF domain-containing protein-like [Bradysia coprophila]|uniref:von Willebrand factor D and EGF domain-containing protein-like n=1 Tax=Bradysia coprophila TaxID=38358 RepID=UPI00187DCF8D|nr:von Willebrand factor D and EGF domain-containing protein-like [Bradysia coprophila]